MKDGTPWDLRHQKIARRDLLAKERAERAASRAANDAPESTYEEDPDLFPPSTAPPRLEESGNTKVTRRRTLDFVARALQVRKECLKGTVGFQVVYRVADEIADNNSLSNRI